MAFDFPASPTNGQVYSPSGGPTYVWKAATTTWELQTAGSLYVAKAGDTMTGDLAINKTSPQIYLQKGAGGQNVIYGMTGGTARWVMILGDTVAEAGSNVGANFNLLRYDDLGNYLGSPIVINRQTGFIDLYGSAAQKNGDFWVQQAAPNQAMGVIRFGTDVNKYLWYNGTDFHFGGGHLVLDNSKGINCNSVQSATFVNSATISTTSTIVSGAQVYAKYTMFVDAVTSTDNPSVTFRNEAGTTAGYLYWAHTADEMILFHYSGQTIRLASWGMASTHDSCFKPSGGPWVAGSDLRIKNIVGAYEGGLDEVLKLEPITYTYRGNDSLVGKEVNTEKEFVGLVAQVVEPVMPEMVGRVNGYIDEKYVEDIYTLDTGPLIYALVNAVKTLTSRIEQLEEKLNAPSQRTAT